MHTTELIRPPAGDHALPSASEHPNVGDMLAEIVPLIGAVAGYGPPVIFLAGPWLLLVLMLSGPFALLLTLVAVMLVTATVLVALTAAIVGAPYLVIRRLRTYWAHRAFSHDHAAQLVPVGSTRVAA
jgi:hypothetical protein